jgi:hypothetical protein
MSQHYTRNTVSTSKYCNVCKRLTQHAVFDRRVAHCLEHGGGKPVSEYAEFIAHTVSAQLRLETIATMMQDGEMSEREAISILDRQQIPMNSEQG